MKNKRVLFVDDEKPYIDQISIFLEKFGYHVLVATTAVRALEIIKDCKPDVVFFDFKMPEMEGDSLFKQAKDIFKDAKYYLVTAYRNDAAMEYFRGLGVTGIIMKPVDLDQILETLNSPL